MAATAADNKYRAGFYRGQGGNTFVGKSTASGTIFGGWTHATGSTTAFSGTQTFGGANTFSGTNTFTGSVVRDFVSATASVALTAALSGTHYLSAVVGNIFTLPAATTAGGGVSYRINTASGGHFASATAGSSGVNFKLRPQAADTVYGAGVAGATDSEVVQMLATGSVVGDGLEVRCDGTNWLVVNYTGTYGRAAAT